MIMMLRLLVQAGALQNSQSPIDTEGAGIGLAMEPFRVLPLFNFAHFPKVNTALMSRFSATLVVNQFCCDRDWLRSPEPQPPK